MASLTDAHPVGPLTDSVMLSVEDKLVYEVGRDEYPLLSLLPNAGRVSQFYYRFAERGIPTMSGTLLDSGASGVEDANATNTDLSLTGNTNILSIGDEIEVRDTSLYTADKTKMERMIVTGGPTAATPAVYTVMRGARGTTAYNAFTVGDEVYIVGKDTRAAGQTITPGRSQKKAFVAAYVQAFEEGISLVAQEKGIGQPLGKSAADSWADEKILGLHRWKSKVELAFINGIATAAHETGAADREGYATAGLASRITAALGSVVVTLDAAGQLTQSKFDTDVVGAVLAKYNPKGELWALGGRKVYEAGPTWLTARSIVQGQNLKGIFGAESNRYQSQNGPVIRFIYEAAMNIFPKDTLFLINPAFVQVVNGPNQTRIPQFIDAAQRMANIKEGFWQGEAGLKISCPWAHAKVLDILSTA